MGCLDSLVRYGISLAVIVVLLCVTRILVLIGVCYLSEYLSCISMFDPVTSLIKWDCAVAAALCLIVAVIRSSTRENQQLKLAAAVQATNLSSTTLCTSHQHIT